MRNQNGADEIVIDLECPVARNWELLSSLRKEMNELIDKIQYQSACLANEGAGHVVIKQKVAGKIAKYEELKAEYLLLLKD